MWPITLWFACALYLTGSVAEASEVERTVARRWSRAVEYQNAGMYDTAAAEWTTLISEFPDDRRIPDALSNLGLCYLAKKEYRLSAMVFSGLIASHRGTPSGTAAWHWLAICHDRLAKAGKGSYRSAAETYGRAFQANPSGEHARFDLLYRAYCLQSDGRLLEARQEAQRFTELWQEGELVPSAWLLLGVLDQAQGKGDDAAQVFQMIIAKWPGGREALFANEAEAQRHMRAGRYVKAAEHFLAASRDPQLADISLFGAAFCLERDGQRHEAVKLYDRVIEDFPKSKYSSMARDALRHLSPAGSNAAAKEQTERTERERWIKTPAPE